MMIVGNVTAERFNRIVAFAESKGMSITPMTNGVYVATGNGFIAHITYNPGPTQSADLSIEVIQTPSLFGFHPVSEFDAEDYVRRNIEDIQ